jgi:hypothetical protein
MKSSYLITIILISVFTLSLKSQDIPASSDTTCKAAFAVTLDSLTNKPYYYHLKDISTGNINIWHWDFGDGTSSQEQNPSHFYDKPGTYTICLTVADINDPSGCHDSYCQQVSTLQYFSLGGLVYAGDYPLNNPEHTGDTGVASLYRIVNDQLIYLEDHYFQDYGYYWFGYLYPGEYLLKVGLTPGSVNYKEYFTTYYGDKINWAQSSVLNVIDADIFEAEIHLAPVTKTTDGQGMISGYLKFEGDIAFNNPPFSRISVILTDYEKNPLLFARPDANGFFSFSDLPYGTYYLSADATGKPSSTTQITLSFNEPAAEGISLTVFSSGASQLREVIHAGLSLVQIYPNPVKDNITVKYYAGNSGNASVKILDLSGKIHHTRNEYIEEGYSQFLLPAVALPHGVYLLLIQPEGYSLPVTAKFIK